MKFPVYLILFLIISCSPKIQYLGKTYAPTQNVDIFFNESDINRPFTTIGMIRNSGKSYEKNNPEVIKTAMLTKAMQVGADAIIFHGMYKEVVRGQTTDTYGNKNGDDLFTISNSSVHFTKVYEGSLIKYK